MLSSSNSFRSKKSGLGRSLLLKVHPLTRKIYKALTPFVSWVDYKYKIQLLTLGITLLKGKASTDPQKALQQVRAGTLDPSNLSCGLNLIGYPSAEMGMGEHLRWTAQALAQNHVPIEITDVGANINAGQRDRRFEKFYTTRPSRRVNLFCVSADQMAHTIVGNATLLTGTPQFNIGYWHWELARFPKELKGAFRLVHELWAPSQFVRDCLAEISPVEVISMPVAVGIWDLPTLTREHFGLPEDQFLFLFSFDIKSYIKRKNPEACIKAFQKAFPSYSEKVGLVFKINRADEECEELRRLLERKGNDPRIHFINKVLTCNEHVGLENVCDSFISLHRSEGFGRCLAECMALGKPVIGTAYSGNMDFMNDTNSCLVNYSLLEVEKGDYLFGQGQVWANPDIEQAAWHMKRLVEDSAYRYKIGQQAREDITKFHNPKAIGTKYQSRLKQLGLL